MKSRQSDDFFCTKKMRRKISVPNISISHVDKMSFCSKHRDVMSADYCWKLASHAKMKTLEISLLLIIKYIQLITLLRKLTKSSRQFLQEVKYANLGLTMLRMQFDQKNIIHIGFIELLEEIQ